MYWYYFQSARGIRIWWKEWVTKFQIIQFIIDLGTSHCCSFFLFYFWLYRDAYSILTNQLGFVYFASYTYFTSSYFPNMPNMGECSGEEFAAFAGIGILSSYLVLFISFYLATYRKDGRKTTSRKAVRRMSQAPLPDPHDLLVGVQATASTTGAKPKTSGVTTRSRKA